ncbi:hypothetical protein KCV87_32295 [Actinosynnema pretiosum subsp. pretiosum]|uniref:Uncharacterized protein n=1 Tax=Actinosynnema pretiosum subsp. pretiosum TaxID=103721 RepID=A0AA45L5K6_9PSEU|nr:hypothetical protein APASM_4680 [Actinosynnema pretiosum subsp. pretiosum]QUF03984.1 hypothetical protein KCV87_32295 [Actinosynnema pretiosum subsp. pretiosum]
MTDRTELLVTVPPSLVRELVDVLNRAGYRMPRHDTASILDYEAGVYRSVAALVNAYTASDPFSGRVAQVYEVRLSSLALRPMPPLPPRGAAVRVDADVHQPALFTAAARYCEHAGSVAVTGVGDVVAALAAHLNERHTTQAVYDVTTGDDGDR